MRKRISYIILIFFLMQNGCERSQKRVGILDQNAPKVVEARGYTVPGNSMAKPRVVLAGKPTVMLAGKPKVVLINTNVHPAGIPRVVKVRTPRMCTPGKDGFSLPKIFRAIDSPFMAGIPEVVIAKEAYTKDHNPQNFSSFGKLQGLKGNDIRSLLEDRKGNLWIGTWGGLSKYDGKRFTHFTDKEGLSDNDIRNILQDKCGGLWFGTYRGGVSRYDGNRFTHYTMKEGLSDNSTRSILEDKSGNLWFGGSEFGISKYDGKSFTYFTDKDGMHRAVISMLEDKSGNLWFGDWSGVSKYDGKTFTHFTEKEGLSNNIVSSILEDKGGNLWLGTAVGFSKLKKEKVSSITKVRANEPASTLNDPRPLFKNYTYEDGFSGIDVNNGKTIHEAKDGTIWIGSNDRLTAFHPGAEPPDTLAPNVQLTGVTLFNEAIAWQNLIPASGWDRQNTDSYRAEIKDTSIILGNGVSVDDFHFDSASKWYGVPERLSLAYNNNFLAFQFVGITLQSPKKVKYRFKLEGLDENWSTLTDRTEAPYGNLPHGKYTFKIKAMNGDGYWSKEFRYSFIIRPPWWYTWWAYVLYVILLAAGISSIVYYRSRSLRRELEQRKKEQQLTELKQQKSELEMQALRAQMNPHFIFNSLNSINMFILENNKLQASEYLSKFSRLVRLILQNSQEAFIPLERELEALQLYLELESLRFEQRFDYKISTGDEIDTTALEVPPLIIQPYVENAIWHGLMHKKEKGCIEIELYQEEEILLCKITDDGVGRKTSAELKSKSALTYKSAGMGITASRIALLEQRKQNEASILINDLVLPNGKPGGTEVLIKIPLCYD